MVISNKRKKLWERIRSWSLKMQSVRNFVVDELKVRKGYYRFFNNYCYINFDEFNFDTKDFVQISNISFITDQSLNIEYAIKR